MEISVDTLADEFDFDTMDGYSKQWDLNGESVTIGVKKI